MWWKAAIGFFLVLGIAIGVFSVYKASVDGLMRKVGLVRADFNVAVIQEKIMNVLAGAKVKTACDLPTRLRGITKFKLASDREQGKLAFEIGEQRIYCGSTLLTQGRAQEGTYEIIKGISYLRQGYQFVEERAETERAVCQDMPDQDLDLLVGNILESTSGKVYEVIWHEWKQTAESRAQVSALCLDQHSL